MKIVLFGAGGGARSLLFLLKMGVTVVALVDNKKSLQGQTFESYPIYHPDYLISAEFDYIVISCIFGKEIKKQLMIEYHISAEKIIDFYDTESLFEEYRVGMLGACARELYKNKVDGMVAELGVYKGDFAKYINLAFSDRTLYLFDTFKGFDQEELKGVKSQIDLKGNEFCDTSVETVLARMPYPDKCICKKGYFPDSASDLDERFALVSLDSDLYDSIYNGLMYFWPRLNEGGYLFLHDYNASIYKEEVQRAVKDFKENYSFNYVPLCDVFGSIVLIK